VPEMWEEINRVIAVQHSPEYQAALVVQSILEAHEDAVIEDRLFNRWAERGGTFRDYPSIFDLVL